MNLTAEQVAILTSLVKAHEPPNWDDERIERVSLELQALGLVRYSTGTGASLLWRVVAFVRTGVVEVLWLPVKRTHIAVTQTGLDWARGK